MLQVCNNNNIKTITEVPPCRHNYTDPVILNTATLSLNEQQKQQNASHNT